MTSDVLISSESSITTIRLNRVDKRNALTAAMYTDITQALLDADVDGKIRVVFLTGSADCFTSGNDVADFLQNPPVGESSPVMHFLRVLSTFKKPIVAAVGGAAVGVGTTMLLHCDLIYAAQSAVFQMPFVNLGLCPEAASSYLLPVLTGLPKAAEILMLGESFTAEAALNYGLINAVLSDDQYQTIAYENAKKLAAQPAAGVRLTKQLLRQSHAERVQAVIGEESEYFKTMLRSPEAIEAMSAFLQKRKPDFTCFD